MTTAGMLACPQCGAAVSPDAGHCDYCRAVLAVVACPRCFARIFHGYQHCPHCGSDVALPQARPAVARRCPRCGAGVELLARQVGTVTIDECAGCHGLWVERVVLERILRERSAEAVAPLRELGIAPPGPAPAQVPASGGRMYVPCPDCRTVMNRVNFAHHSGVILDVCRPHGTWFDADELRRVIEFVLAGGVEEAARRDLDEKRAELRRATAAAEVARASATWTSRGAEDDDGLLGRALYLIAKMLTP